MSTTSPATDDAFDPSRGARRPHRPRWPGLRPQSVDNGWLRVRRLPGATSSVLHELVVASPGGAHCELVLRRYVHPLWRRRRRRPGRTGRRWRSAAARVGPGGGARADRPPTPRASTPATPALLMTRAPGRPVLHGGPAWLARLAQVYERLASWSRDRRRPARLPALVPTTPGAAALEPPREPVGRGHRAGHRRAPGPSPASASQPIHRDLHPANILFRRGRPAAVVDWVNACIGPFASELARGRANLAVLAGLDAADAFLAATGALGRDYDPWWDLSVCVRAPPRPHRLRRRCGALGGRCDVGSARAALDAAGGCGRSPASGDRPLGSTRRAPDGLRPRRDAAAPGRRDLRRPRRGRRDHRRRRGPRRRRPGPAHGPGRQGRPRLGHVVEELEAHPRRAALPPAGRGRPRLRGAGRAPAAPQAGPPPGADRCRSSSRSSPRTAS